MESLNDSDFEILDKCPWGGDSSEYFSFIYKDFMGCDIVKCKKCGIVFAKRRLNKSGLSKYWEDYLSRVHKHDDDMNIKRKKMYQIDFNFINNYCSHGKVLDVGCSNGDFMTFFENKGYDTYGIEFGTEAAELAMINHKVKCGILPDMKIDEKFDLIVFRGVLQYFPDVKRYLSKALDLLSDKGFIFITAQPNMDSYCFKLFKGKFSLPVTGADFIGYTETIFTNYFIEHGLKKVAEKYFYEETPYADLENDILKVAEAIKTKNAGKEIESKAPAFYGNMMSVIYQK